MPPSLSTANIKPFLNFRKTNRIIQEKGKSGNNRIFATEILSNDHFLKRWNFYKRILVVGALGGNPERLSDIFRFPAFSTTKIPML